MTALNRSTRKTQGSQNAGLSLVLGVALAVGALAAGLQTLLEGSPNVAPIFAVVFLAGVIAGPVAGLFSGLSGMAFYSLGTGFYGIYTVAPALAMGLVGALGGFLARARFRSWSQSNLLSSVFACALAGFLVTMTFSVTADVIEWVYAVLGALPALHATNPFALVAAGLAFNFETALVNAAVFAAVTVPAMRAAEGLARTRWAGPLVGPLLERAEGSMTTT